MKYFGILLFITTDAYRMSRSSEAWHWGYKNNQGEDWSQHVSECGKDRQSPIDIPAQTAEKPITSEFLAENYEKTVTWDATNTGHGIKLALTSDEKLTVSGGHLPGTYVLAQFHFHWGSDSQGGSEHLIDGERHFAEIHLVHYKDEYGTIGHSLDHDDGLGVLGFFVDVDATAAEGPLDELIQTKISTNLVKLDASKEISFSIEDMITVTNIDNYYRYLGSLTTPTCNEVVVWTVFKEPIKISQKTRDMMVSFAEFDETTDEKLVQNFRTAQPLGSRVVTFYSTEVTEEIEMPQDNTFTTDQTTYDDQTIGLAILAMLKKIVFHLKKMSMPVEP